VLGQVNNTKVGAVSVRNVIALRHVKPWHASGTMPRRHHRPVLPNPSVNRTRYGRQRKAGAQRLRHCRAPALRRPPPRAGYLER
jgi:hypothetical protein